MKIEVSIGEVLDKYTILLIKEIKISDEKKLYNVRKERQYLESIIGELSASIKIFVDDLFSINEKLWNIEDQIRTKDSLNQFDEEFISLARSVYHTNDERAKMKKTLNELCNSEFVEEKQYSKYRN